MASPAAVQSPPLHRRATLTDLPKELLRIIALFSDRPSAVALARVSRTLTDVAELRIWREVDLSLNPHHGEYPLIRPHIRTTARPGQEWSIEAAKAAEERHREAIRQKVREVIKNADHRRCGMVKKLRMVPRPGAVAGLLTFLDLVAPTITTLEIESPPKHPFDDLWRPQDKELLDLRLVDARLDLPALTHLRLGQGSIRFKEVIPFICSRASNLHSLQVCLDQDATLTWDETIKPAITSLNIRELYIIYPRSGTCEDDKLVENISNLLRMTPHIHRFSFDSEQLGYSEGEDLAIALDNMSSLEELDCRIDPDCFNVNDGISPRLRRVLYRCTGWDPTIAPFSTCSSLEVIFLTPWIDGPLQIGEGTRTTKPTTAYPLHPTFAKELREMPLLRIIHTLQESVPSNPDIWAYLDGIDTSDAANGYINSVRQDEREMFFCYFLFQYHEVSDHSIADHPISLLPGMSSREYGGRAKVYYHLSEARWQARTDFEGEVVPLEVVEKMRVVDGKSEAEWKGRGISVGEQAWKVLTDWHEGVLAAKTDAGLAATTA